MIKDDMCDEYIFSEISSFLVGKEYDSAISCATEAIDLNRNCEDAYCLRAEAYLNKKEYKNAINDFIKCITLNDRNADAYRGRADCYLITGEKELAIADYKEAKIIKILSKEDYYYRGVSYFYNCLYDLAIIYFNKVISIDPSSTDPNLSEVCSFRGLAYCYLKEYKLACEDLKTAIYLEPENSYYYYYLFGNCYVDLKQYDKALECYNESIKYNSKYSMAFNNRGTIYEDKKEYNKAFQDYSKAIILDPENVYAYLNIAGIYVVYRMYESAIKDYEKAIGINKKIFNDPKLCYDFGSLLFLEGNPAKAKTIWILAFQGSNCKEIEKYFEKPEEMPIEMILNESCIAKRRILLSILGYDLFLQKNKHKYCLDVDGYYGLFLIKMNEEEPIVLLKVKCPTTGMFYTLRVPPDTKTCKEAVAWTFDVNKKEYILENET